MASAHEAKVCVFFLTGAAPYIESSRNSVLQPEVERVEEKALTCTTLFFLFTEGWILCRALHLASVCVFLQSLKSRMFFFC